MSESENLAQLIEQHFALEARLVAGIDELNNASVAMFERGGFRGPTEEDLRELKPLSEAVQAMAQKVGPARVNLLNRINRNLTQPLSSLKEFIRTLDQGSRDRLNQIRKKVLEKSSRTQATLLQNQAVLFYTYDFHRKYLYGVMQCDDEQPSYQADGQARKSKRSNVYGRTC